VKNMGGGGPAATKRIDTCKWLRRNVAPEGFSCDRQPKLLLARAPANNSRADRADEKPVSDSSRNADQKDTKKDIYEPHALQTAYQQIARVNRKGQASE
jgi:hypothetical protein